MRLNVDAFGLDWDAKRDALMRLVAVLTITQWRTGYAHTSASLQATRMRGRGSSRSGLYEKNAAPAGGPR